MIREINIISFNVPFPANYGGVIDVFFKIKHFHEQGVKVHLHSFEYGRGEQKELNKYCESVNYYSRRTSFFSMFSSLPYIVKSRISNKLRENLLQNDFPILFEGLHTCYLLNDPAFKKRCKVVRNHNVEHDYYRQLALIEKNIFKRFYYQSEAKKLKQFESIISNANFCLPISQADLMYFQEKYSTTKFLLVPAFHQNDKIKIKPGKGDYVLYHGNLGVPENNNAALYIINQIFKNLEIPLIIAGLNPSKELVTLTQKFKNITLIANPSNNELDTLIGNAQINLLYTEQATGLKLKLLNVLFNGRFCIVNSKMVEGTSLTDVCLVKDNALEIKTAIEHLFTQEIQTDAIAIRSDRLLDEYSNSLSYNKMMSAF